MSKTCTDLKISHVLTRSSEASRGGNESLNSRKVISHFQTGFFVAEWVVETLPYRTSLETEFLHSKFYPVRPRLLDLQEQAFHSSLTCLLVAYCLYPCTAAEISLVRAQTLEKGKCTSWLPNLRRWMRDQAWVWKLEPRVTGVVRGGSER